MGYSSKPLPPPPKAKFMNGARYIRQRPARPDLVWLKWTIPLLVVATTSMAVLSKNLVGISLWSLLTFIFFFLFLAILSETKHRWIVDVEHESGKAWVTRNNLVRALEAYLEEAGLDTLSASVAASSTLDNLNASLVISEPGSIESVKGRKLRLRLKRLKKNESSVV